MSYLEQYVAAIEAGEIIVGQELTIVLKQLVNDLQDERYRYELKRAHRRIAFIERFCKHTKSPFHGKPFLLELWEKAFIEVVYGFLRRSTGKRRFKRVILLNSRKNGKLTLTAVLAFTEMMMGSSGSVITCFTNANLYAEILERATQKNKSEVKLELA